MTRQEAADEITQIAAYQENWDSYGAPPPTPASIQAGRDLVERCFAVGCEPDKVTGGENIVVYYFGAEGRYANIEACEDGEILACTSDRSPDGISVFSVDDLDEAIKRIHAFALNKV